MTNLTLEETIKRTFAGVPLVDMNEIIQKHMLAFTPTKECLHEDLTKMSVDDLVKKINDVGSNKKSIMFLIGNGINRLKNKGNTNGVLMLTAALSLLAAAGDDASLINLAKKIAYTGLTGR